MKRSISQVSMQFALMVVGFSTGLFLLFLALFYRANNSIVPEDYGSQQLSTVVASNNDVVDYLEEQKAAEAHFITIAQLIKQEQRDQVSSQIVSVTIPAVIISALAGFWLSRLLLRPVKESHDSQQRFMQDAAHEMRNPLAAMSLAVQNAQRSSKTKESADLLKTMKRQTSRLIRINEDLLYLERNTSIADIEAQKVDVSELLLDVIEDLQPVAHMKNITVTNTIEEGVAVKMRAYDFIKLARNIIENAIKFTPKDSDGAVDVALICKDKGFLFVVKDSGVGIDLDDLSKLGQRFFRGKNAVKIKGSGLGLAIVQRVVELYGGEVTYSSEGGGTEVTVHM